MDPRPTPIEYASDLSQPYALQSKVWTILAMASAAIQIPWFRGLGIDLSYGRGGEYIIVWAIALAPSLVAWLMIAIAYCTFGKQNARSARAVLLLILIYAGLISWSKISTWRHTFYP